MAKAIQCDVCGQVVTYNRASGWRALTLQARGFISGDGASTEFDPHADVCSVECAKRWFEEITPACFGQMSSEPALKERSVGA